MMRRHSLIVLFVVAATCVSNAQVIKILGRRPNASTAPNIILLLADDMGVGDVGYYGWNDKVNQVLTPNLDTMAATGLRFDRFYAQSPVCSPTRGSCITGRHAFRYGIWEANVGGMRNEEITLPEVLKTYANYTCGHFGKWHLGRMVPDQNWGKATRMNYSTPGMAGFDEWFSVVHAVKTYDPYGAAGVDDPNDLSDYNPYFHNGVQVTEPLFGDTSEYLMDRAIPFMQGALSQGKPFLTCLWFHTPHSVLDASAADQALYPDGSANEKKYYGAITAMDRQIGRLRIWLHDQGIENNTLVWFTADNGHTGAGSAGPFLGAKRHLFDGGIHVPSILEWPDQIPTNRTTQVLSCTSDLFLTFLDAAGIDYSDTHPRDGISLMPLIEGNMSARTNAIAFQSHNTSVIMNQDYKAMKVRTGAYSDGLAAAQGLPLDEWMLFDMTLTDPFLIERENIASNNAAALAPLTAEYDVWNLSCSNSFYGADYDAPYSPNGSYKGWSADD